MWLVALLAFLGMANQANADVTELSVAATTASDCAANNGAITVNYSATSTFPGENRFFLRVEGPNGFSQVLSGAGGLQTLPVATNSTINGLAPGLYTFTAQTYNLATGNVKDVRTLSVWVGDGCGAFTSFGVRVLNDASCDLANGGAAITYRLTGTRGFRVQILDAATGGANYTNTVANSALGSPRFVDFPGVAVNDLPAGQYYARFVIDAGGGQPEESYRIPFSVGSVCGDIRSFGVSQVRNANCEAADGSFAYNWQVTGAGNFTIRLFDQNGNDVPGVANPLQGGAAPSAGGLTTVNGLAAGNYYVRFEFTPTGGTTQTIRIPFTVGKNCGTISDFYVADVRNTTCDNADGRFDYQFTVSGSGSYTVGLRNSQGVTTALIPATAVAAATFVNPAPVTGLAADNYTLEIVYTPTGGAFPVSPVVMGIPFTIGRTCGNIEQWSVFNSVNATCGVNNGSISYAGRVRATNPADAYQIDIIAQGGAVIPVRPNVVVTALNNPFNGTVTGLPAGNHTLRLTFNRAGGVQEILGFPFTISTNFDPALMACIGGSPSAPGLNIPIANSPTCSAPIRASQILSNGCSTLNDADFTITITDLQNRPVANPVPSTFIGQVLKVSVQHNASGRNCWGYVKIEDKDGPRISCPADRAISCALVAAQATPDTNVAGGFRGRAIDGTIYDCSRLRYMTPTGGVEYTDQVFETACTTPYAAAPAGFPAGLVGRANALIAANAGRVVKLVVRTFRAIDWYDNTSTCQQVIAVTKGRPEDVFVPADLEFLCNVVPASLAPSFLATVAGNDFNGTSVRNNAWPVLDTDGNLATTADRVVLDPNAPQSCNIDAAFDDSRIELCASGYKILRTWTVLDWCSPRGANNPRVFTQLIKVLDKVAPSVTASYITYGRINDGTWCAIDIHGATENLTKWELAARQTARQFDGRRIQGQAEVASTIDEVVALGNSNDCSGRVSFTLTAKDSFCTDGRVTFTSSDARVNLVGTAVFNANTKITTATFTGSLPAGTHLITFTAADDCGYALATKTFRIVVADNVKPQPVCKQDVKVALTSDGTARAGFESFENGSTDNCFLQDIWVRRATIAADTICGNGRMQTRNNPDACFRKFVDFNCDDVNDTVMVVMRVRDSEGNYNDCMVNAIVEDKIAPTCVAPPNMTIDCNQFPNLFNFAQYGEATFLDNCRYSTSVDTTVNLDNCKVGTLTRTWTAADCGGRRSTCRQIITVRNVSDFTVDFPDDVVLSCAAAIKTPAQQRNEMLNNPSNRDGHIINNGCGVLAVEVKDDTLWAQPDGSCLKILRRITVVDWCKFNANNNVTDFNRNAYGKPVCDDVHSNPNWASQNVPAWQNLIRPACETPNERRFRDADALQSDPDPANDNGNINPLHPKSFSDGIISFIQIIKVVDNVAPVVTNCSRDTSVCDFAATGCEGVYKYKLAATDDCGTDRLDNSLNYRWEIYRISDNAVVATGNADTLYRTVGGNRLVGVKLPYDVRYRILWMVSDKCGNMSRCEYNFTIKDCKKPTIICQNVNAELMWVDTDNDGMPDGARVPVWASDLLASPLSDNCTTEGYLNDKLVVIRSDQNAGNTYPTPTAANNRKSVMFSCDDLNRNVEVQLWTIDSAGNADYCRATVNVQGNRVTTSGGNCTGSILRASVAGTVNTEARTNVPNVTVNAFVGGTSNGNSTSTATGSFAIQNLTPGATYQIRAAKTNNTAAEVRRLVTAYDRGLVQGFVLDPTTLTSPYKIIAADVNKDGDVNNLDLLFMQQFILGQRNEFPNNNFWRFLDRSYTFRNPAAPFGEDFREVVNITNMPTNAQANFTALLVGDVSASMDNALLGTTLRSNKTFTVHTEDVNMKAGEQYNVTFSAENVNFRALQGTFNFEQGAVELVGVKGEMKGMSAGNFAMYPTAITTAWNGSADRAETFTITLRARKDARLSEVLTLGSNITYAEAYDQNGDAMDVQLNFKGGKVSKAGFELYQNQPNPANGETRIGFNLPADGAAKLTVYDAAGRVLMVRNGQFAKGYNEMMVTKSELSATGVMYYRLDSNGNTATKKMIIIEQLLILNTQKPF